MSAADGCWWGLRRFTQCPSNQCTFSDRTATLQCAVLLCEVACHPKSSHAFRVRYVNGEKLAVGCCRSLSRCAAQDAAGAHFPGYTPLASSVSACSAESGGAGTMDGVSLRCDGVVFSSWGICGSESSQSERDKQCALRSALSFSVGKIIVVVVNRVAGVLQIGFESPYVAPVAVAPLPPLEEPLYFCVSHLCQQSSATVELLPDGAPCRVPSGAQLSQGCQEKPAALEIERRIRMLEQAGEAALSAT